MKQKTDDRGKSFWDRMAKLYAPIQEKSNAALYHALCECCQRHITPAARVLELACGTGQMTVPLCGGAGSWEATDFSENMLAEARRRCPETVHFSMQDAEALTCADGSFEVVLIANALHVMPHPERALAEIRRVLVPDGLLLAPTFVYEGKVNRLRMWVTCKLGFPNYFEWTFAELEELLQKAGFTAVEKELIPGDPLPVGFIAARRADQ